jgi:Domain of unknown function (DUF4062)
MLNILISSTCNDLKEERHYIKRDLSALGYNVNISEQDDILFDPNDPTHISCIDAVKENDIVIFLIGTRFGGKAVSDAVGQVGLELLENSKVDFFKTNNKISITHCEILSALKNKVPIYTFIRSEVSTNHHLYETNKKNGFPANFNFPNFKGLEEAKYIFEFYNFIRKDRPGNYCKSFEISEDIVKIMKFQLMEYFTKLFRNAKQSKLPKQSQNVINADVVGHDSNDRQNYFDKFYPNIDSGDTLRVMGTGVTSFLSRKDRIRGLLKGGTHIQLLLINNQIIKGDFQCSSDNFLKKIKVSLQDSQVYLANESKVHCPLFETKFLIDTKHFNKYHNREKEKDYHKKIQDSIKLIQEYQDEFEMENYLGKITAKHFNSFVPLSITAIYNDKVNDNELIAEFILPFSENRIIFNSTKEDNPKVYKIFMDFFTSTWDNSNNI